LAITVLLDVKDIPQVGPLQWGRITPASNSVMTITRDCRSVRPPPMLHCTVRTARHAAGRHRAFRKRSMRIGGGSSDDLLPPSPPAKKATARGDQAGQPGSSDWTGDARPTRLRCLKQSVLTEGQHACKLIGDPCELGATCQATSGR